MQVQERRHLAPLLVTPGPPRVALGVAIYSPRRMCPVDAPTRRYQATGRPAALLPVRTPRGLPPSPCLPHQGCAQAGCAAGQNTPAFSRSRGVWPPPFLISTSARVPRAPRAGLQRSQPQMNVLEAQNSVRSTRLVFPGNFQAACQSAKAFTFPGGPTVCWSLSFGISHVFPFCSTKLRPLDFKITQNPSSSHAPLHQHPGVHGKEGGPGPSSGFVPGCHSQGPHKGRLIPSPSLTLLQSHRPPAVPEPARHPLCWSVIGQAVPSGHNTLPSPPSSLHSKVTSSVKPTLISQMKTVSPGSPRPLPGTSL